MTNEYGAPSRYAPTYVQLDRAYQELKQQRAELLEALKECVEFYSYAEFGPIAKARQAITKAEAAE